MPMSRTARIALLQLPAFSVDEAQASLDKQIADGYISKFFIDRPFAPATFGEDAKAILDVPFKVETDISVMKASSKLALSPALKL